jgi:hypothetical protein
MYVAEYIELMSATNWVNFDDNGEFNDYDVDGGLWKKWVIYGGVFQGMVLATNSLKLSTAEVVSSYDPLK